MRARVRLVALCMAPAVLAGPLAAPAGLRAAELFRRGDANADGAIDIADAVRLLVKLFAGGRPLPCQKAADVDDSGSLEITDAIAVLGYLFQLGGEPAAPFPGCGADPTADSLPCDAHPPCEFEEFVSQYTIIRTIAGAGELRGKGVNGWRPEFEGGPAIEAELSRPHFAMRDAAGNLYIADKDAQAIRMVDGDGLIHTVAGTGEIGDGPDEPGPGTTRALFGPNGIWVRGDGTVYILDSGNAKIRRLSPDGTLETLFRDPGGIVIGRGLWVRDDEELVFFSSGSELKRWTPESGVEVISDAFVELGNLAIDPSGALVVTDRGEDDIPGGNRVYRIGAGGEPIPIAGTGLRSGGHDGDPALEVALAGVRGVWFLDSGAYLLATHEGSQIWYVDTRGRIHLFIDGRDDHTHRGDGGPPAAPGPKISEARAVTIDREGNILITENDFGFIREVVHR